MAIQSSADVDEAARIDASATVWHLAQIRAGAVIGAGCTIGRGAYVGTGVVLGENCKLQNYALIYEPAELADGVFVGPGAIFTNDHHPRAVSPQGVVKSAADWDAVGVTCETGVSIGAGAICVAPIRIGRWAMIGAGSVVTRDVAAHALVVGSPARQVGWVGRSGQRLRPAVPAGTDAIWVCPESGERYLERDGGLRLVEEAAA